MSEAMILCYIFSLKYVLFAKQYFSFKKVCEKHWKTNSCTLEFTNAEKINQIWLIKILI